jgi:EAL domain-containing protein (putative c-di-GMP-specific phosphodiesterase class I)
MYHAKAQGRGRVEHFTDVLATEMADRAQLESDLRVGLERDQFALVFQPQVAASDGRIIAAEALLRWRHPTLGLLPPERFIGVAEDCGLMVPIGAWVLEQACAEAQRWRAAGQPLVVAINLSPTQFLQRDLADGVRAALAASGLPPALLELELTEAVIMRHSGIAQARLEALRALGVRLAIDDFGTGYSRVGHLREYPVGKLKIDGSFVDGIADGDGAPVIAIIAMAHSLGLTVLAEGVETELQLSFLQQHGCDQYQGRYAKQDGQLDGLAGLLDGAQ